MNARRTTLIAAVLTLTLPSAAHAAGGDAVQSGVTTFAGIIALLVAAVLLVEMLSLRKLASGSAIADNITYAVLAVTCLTSSVLVGWIARYVPAGFTAEQARLGADLLALAAMVLFLVYFLRVRRAMSRFLSRLSGMEQDLISTLDPDADIELLGEDSVG
ncbi:MAG: hypothetical protein ACYC77_10165 [Coriobacteriia bacterium]